MEIEKKSRTDRILEVVNVMKSLRDDLKIPLDHPSVVELKKVLDVWIEDGKTNDVTVNFSDFGRMAEVNCPSRSDKSLEVKLRVVRVGRK
jgi:hypothetical protein